MGVMQRLGQVGVASDAAASARARALADRCGSGVPDSDQVFPGARFGRLKVLGTAEPYVWRGRVARRQWHCECDCGRRSIVREDALRSGHTASCACLRRDLTIERLTRHEARAGGARTPEYNVWQALLQRQPATKVCARWRQGDGLGFLSFVEDVGHRPSPRHRLVRLDERSGFSARNCEWSDAATRRGVPRVSIRVKRRTLTLREAAAIYGVSYALLCKRLARGWSPERAVVAPQKAGAVAAMQPASRG
jgi:hypothetical protein